MIKNIIGMICEVDTRLVWLWQDGWGVRFGHPTNGWQSLSVVQFAGRGLRRMLRGCCPVQFLPARGSFIMGVMNNGMSIMGIGIDYQQVIKGLVLLAAVIFDVYNKQKQR